jgi:hypothetical protein
VILDRLPLRLDFRAVLSEGDIDLRLHTSQGDEYGRVSGVSRVERVGRLGQF